MRSCFVAGCKTGNKKEMLRLKNAGERIPSMFSSPKDPALFEQWQRVIPRADRKLTFKDGVCELHFREEDIDYVDELKLFDGSIYRYEKLKRRVKPGRVPSIFSNIPGHSTHCVAQNKATKVKKAYRRKSMSKRIKKKNVNATQSEKIALSPILTEQVMNQDTDFQVPITEKKFTEAPTIPKNLTEAPIIEEKLSLNTNLNLELLNKEEPAKEKSNEFLQMIIDILTKESELIQASPVTEEQILECSNEHSTFESEPLETTGEEFSFNFVKMNLHVIKKTSSWWAVNAFENFIICARWNSDYVVERKIIIFTDLSYKVFLKEKAIKMWDDFKLKSLKNISQIIEQVENIHACNGLNNQNSNCYGFVQLGIVVCRRKNLCISCARFQTQLEKEEKKRLREEKRIKAQQIELLRIRFRY